MYTIERPFIIKDQFDNEAGSYVSLEYAKELMGRINHWKDKHDDLTSELDKERQRVAELEKKNEYFRLEFAKQYEELAAEKAKSKQLYEALKEADKIICEHVALHNIDTPEYWVIKKLLNSNEQ